MRSWADTYGTLLDAKVLGPFLDPELQLKELHEAVALPGTLLLVTPAAAVTGAFADLVRRIEEGAELRAARIDPAQAQGPKIVSYRGHTRLD